MTLCPCYWIAIRANSSPSAKLCLIRSQSIWEEEDSVTARLGQGRERGNEGVTETHLDAASLRIIRSQRKHDFLLQPNTTHESLECRNVSTVPRLVAVGALVMSLEHSSRQSGDEF